MSRFFKPYEGKQPFLFVSYAHRQSEEVVGTIKILHDRGYRVWYDEGIPAGSDWPASIAKHVRECGGVLFFVSERALESPNCFSEMSTADRAGKPIYWVSLEKTENKEKWDPILKKDYEISNADNAEERADNILKSGLVTRRFRTNVFKKIPWRIIGLAVSVLFFAVAVAALWAITKGRWKPFSKTEEPVELISDNKLVDTADETITDAVTEPTAIPYSGERNDPGKDIDDSLKKFYMVDFKGSVVMKDAVRRALDIPAVDDIYTWDLSNITELYCFGDSLPKGFDKIVFDADGNAIMDGQKIKMGDIKDLSLLKNMPNLQKLSLAYQPIDNLYALDGLELLNELSIAGCPVDDFGRLKNLPSLEILHIEHTQIKDLTKLKNFPELKTVTVSRDMLPLKWDEDARFEVVLLNE